VTGSRDRNTTVPAGVRDQLRGVRAALLDVDGTLLRPHGPTIEQAELLPGAAAVVQWLKDRGIALACYTNGTSAVPEEYAERLRAHGLPVADDEMLTPAAVAAYRLERDAPGARVLAFGGDGLTKPLAGAGVELVAPADEDTRADIVLIGYDHDLTTDKLVAACYAVWAGAAVWTTSVAPSYARFNGRGVGLPGALAAAIEHVTGTEAEIVGKPSRLSMEVVRARTGAAYEATLVVGDDQDIEVAMGREAGALTALVLTGTTGAKGDGALERYPQAARPDLILDDVGQLLGWLGG
jgi:HAD superfamily hydrolase (TIGR01450 family)